MGMIAYVVEHMWRTRLAGLRSPRSNSKTTNIRPSDGHYNSTLYRQQVSVFNSLFGDAVPKCVAHHAAGVCTGKIKQYVLRGITKRWLEIKGFQTTQNMFGKQSCTLSGSTWAKHQLSPKLRKIHMFCLCGSSEHCFGSGPHGREGVGTFSYISKFN